MREILFSILLGCLFTFTVAQRGLFEFHDSYGRCWRCLPGRSCVRCSTTIVRLVSGRPVEWDKTCPEPIEQCKNNPGVKFPHVDIGFYWICADEGVVAVAPCFCDHVFDMRKQECVKSNYLTTIACNEYANSEPHDCASEETRPPPSTLAPNEGDTTTTTTTPPSIITPPTVPNEGDTTTTTTTTTTKPVYPPTAPNYTGTTTTTTTRKPVNPPTVPNYTGTTTTTTTRKPINPPTVPNYTGPTTTTTTTKKPIWIPTAPNEPGQTTTPTTTTTKDITTTTTTSNDNGITDPITIPTRTTEIAGPGNTAPTVPNFPPTPRPPPNGPTLTTEDSGAGVTHPGITPSVPSNTTPAPCVCVVWWPCWCNPCWNMPCHSCHGCVGRMMG